MFTLILIALVTIGDESAKIERHFSFTSYEECATTIASARVPNDAVAICVPTEQVE